MQSGTQLPAALPIWYPEAHLAHESALPEHSLQLIPHGRHTAAAPVPDKYSPAIHPVHMVISVWEQTEQDSRHCVHDCPLLVGEYPV